MNSGLLILSTLGTIQEHHEVTTHPPKILLCGILVIENADSRPTCKQTGHVRLSAAFLSGEFHV